MDTQTIRSFPLFATFAKDDLDALLAELVELDLAPGEVLMAEGGRTEKVYLLLEGEVEVCKSMGPSEERLLGVRGKGTMLGEMSIFNDNRTHTATVRARTAVKVLAMTFLQFDRMVHRHPEIAYGMLRMVSRRLQATDETVVADLREKNEQLTLAYEELKAAQAALIIKEKIEHELQLAASIQRSMLPQKLPSHHHLDFGALMIPARMVGGDYFDFIPLPGERMGVVVGDVCDKGMPAALYMALSCSALRIEASRHHAPGDTLRAVNRHLLRMSQSNMYVTLLYGVLDLREGTFTFARAGHPYPLLLDRDNRAVAIPAGRGQPLGMFTNVALDEQVVAIPAGGTMLVYSDGLSETIEAREHPLELDELCAEVMTDQPHTAQELCERLWHAAGAGGAGNPLIEDDFTVVAIKHREDAVGYS